MTFEPQPSSVSSENPLCVIVLVDQSSSMSRPQATSGARKCDVVADIVNDLLQELVSVSTASRGPFPYKNYFDVAVFGYGPGSAVHALLSADDRGPGDLGLFHIGEIAATYVPVKRNGSDRHERFKARASGPTLMVEAFG